MRRIPRFIAPLLLALLLVPGTALAHKVNIYAYVDGKNIVTDCFFSKTDKVHNGLVTITDAQTGAVLATGTTDDKGALTLPVPPQAIASGHDLKLLLKAGEGHQSDTVIQASEFAALKTAAADKPGAAATAKASAKATKAQPSARQPAAAEGAPAATAPSLGEAELTRIVTQAVDQAVESRMAPVKRMLVASAEKGPGPTEIVGGIGYIVGLFGIAAFVASRRKDRHRE
jgi:nickel transport protein